MTIPTPNIAQSNATKSGSEPPRTIDIVGYCAAAARHETVPTPMP